MEQMIYLANKAKANEFMESLFEDLEKYGIEKIDPPKPIKESSDKKEKSKSKKGGRKGSSRGSRSPVVILPFDSRPGQKGWGKGDQLSFIEELMNMSGNKWADGEFATDDSELDSQDSDEENNREDYTSDSDNEK